jgi:hypothetical protein
MFNRIPDQPFFLHLRVRLCLKELYADTAINYEQYVFPRLKPGLGFNQIGNLTPEPPLFFWHRQPFSKVAGHVAGRGLWLFTNPFSNPLFLRFASFNIGGSSINVTRQPNKASASRFPHKKGVLLLPRPVMPENNETEIESPCISGLDYTTASFKFVRFTNAESSSF